MANERMYQFPPKASPVPADLIYAANSADSNNEVSITIAQLISAYPNLSGIAGLTLGSNTYAYVNNSSAWTAGTISALAVSLLADTSTGTMQTTLGLVIGTNVQAHSAALDSIAGLTTVANELIYTTASNTYAVIAAAASSVLITSAGNVPSLSQTLPSIVQGNITLLGAQSQALNMNSHLINSVTDPVSAQDAATKNYVDTQIANFATVFVARLASTTALTVTYSNGTAGVGATLTNAGAQVALSLDGSSAVVNDLVLIKNQASALQNGYYLVSNIGSGSTNWVLTRAVSYDQASEINPGDLFVVTAGSTQANTTWIETATVTTIGTDAISFSQYSVALPITVAFGGTGVTTLTAYGLLSGGTTATGALQQVTIGAVGTILRSGGASALASYSTTTYPATNAINTLLYASSANVMSALATANSGVLVTDSGGIPSISSTLPAFTTSSITFNPTTGGIVGTTTNDNVAAGKVGEFVSSVIAAASAVTVANATSTNITTISLTAGDWDVWGNVNMSTVGVGNVAMYGWISTSSAALPDASLFNALNITSIGAGTGFSVPYTRISLSGTTTVYLSAFQNQTSGTTKICGAIYARRVR